MNISIGSIKACHKRSQRTWLASLKLHLYTVEPFISCTYHKTAISANIAAAIDYPLCISPSLSPQSHSCWKVGLFHRLCEACVIWHMQRMLGLWWQGLYACFVFFLSKELSDLITKSDVLRQLRISHQKTSEVQRNRWSGFEYCFLLASILTQVRTINTSKKRSLFADWPKRMWVVITKRNQCFCCL